MGFGGSSVCGKVGSGSAVTSCVVSVGIAVGFDGSGASVGMAECLPLIESASWAEAPKLD